MFSTPRFWLSLIVLGVSCGDKSNDDDDDDWGDDSTSTLDSPYGSGGGGGYYTYQHFPLDGAERSWLYKHQNKDFLLSVEMLPDPTRLGSRYIHVLRYAVDDPYRVLHSIKWSSDEDYGVQIHGYQIENFESDTGGDPSSSSEWVNFERPIQVATAVMEVGDELLSTAAGVTYKSRFDALEGCPNDWRDDWECIRITITADTANSAPFVGTWHNATRFGTSLFQPEGTDHPWTLVTADYVAD